MKLFELFDSKTDRLVKVGTEEECIEYTKKEPEKKFYMVEVKEATKDTK